MNKVLSFKEKLGYGTGMVGECLAMNVFYLFFLIYLTDAVGINAGIAGMIGTLGTFIGAFTDLYVGPKSDRSKNVKGRRRPFIIKGAIFLGIATFLVYTDWSFIPDNLKPAYYVIMTIVFWFTLSFADIPYISLGSEITNDYAERIEIKGISNTLNYVGMILASSGTLMIVSMLSKDGGITDTVAWSKLGLIFGIIVAGAYLIAAAATKGREKYTPTESEKTETKENSLKAFIEVLSIKAYWPVLLYTILAYGGGMLHTSSYMYFLSYNAAMTESQQAVVTFVYALIVMLLSAIIGKIMLEKKYVAIVATLIAAVSFIVMHFLPATLFTVWIMVIFEPFLWAAYWVPVFAMVYDVCDIDEYKSGKAREGAVVSLFYFFVKIVGGISLFAVGWILNYCHYDAMAYEQTAEVLTGISAATWLIPGILMVLGAIVLFKYPVNKKNYASLIKAIKARNDGEDYSEEDFKEIIK